MADAPVAKRLFDEAAELHSLSEASAPGLQLQILKCDSRRETEGSSYVRHELEESANPAMNSRW